MNEGSQWDGAVVVALGGNLDLDGRAPAILLQSALERFPEEGLHVARRSSWWRSAAWPDPTQPDYLNGVAIVETALDPAQTLAALHRIEAALGRVRDKRNAARTVDLDLIAHGRALANAPGLVIPHPRANERLFVMGPLTEIAPAWRHPVSGRSAAALAAAATVGRDARPL